MRVKVYLLGGKLRSSCTIGGFLDLYSLRIINLSHPDINLYYMAVYIKIILREGRSLVWSVCLDRKSERQRIFIRWGT